MAKSTVTAALASLQHKYRAKIKEVGSLRRILAELTTNSTTPDEDTNRKLYDTERAKKQQFAGKAATALSEIRILQQKVVDAEELSLKFSFKAQDAIRRGELLETQLENRYAEIRNLKDAVSNWKSLSVILFITGAAIGGLSYMAYIAQTAGL